MSGELEYLDDIADQSAFSGGEGGFKNGMRANPNRRRRDRKRRSLPQREAAVSSGLLFQPAADSAASLREDLP